jgi:hypothetical protein
MRKHKSTPSERIVQAFLVTLLAVIAYHIAGCTALLYYQRAYPSHNSPIPTEEPHK